MGCALAAVSVAAWCPNKDGKGSDSGRSGSGSGDKSCLDDADEGDTAWTRSPCFDRTYDKPTGYDLTGSSYACQRNDRDGDANPPVEDEFEVVVSTFEEPWFSDGGSAVRNYKALTYNWNQVAEDAWIYGEWDVGDGTTCMNCLRFSTPVSSRGNAEVTLDDRQMVFLKGSTDNNVTARTKCWDSTDSEYAEEQKKCFHEECDIQFYRENIDGDIYYSYDDDPLPGYTSMSWAMTHELGHALGLYENASLPDSPMDWCTLEDIEDFGCPMVTPSEDDIQATVHIYGCCDI